MVNIGLGLLDLKPHWNSWKSIKLFSINKAPRSPVCGRCVGHAGPQMYTTDGLRSITCVWPVCWPCRASHVHHWWAGIHYLCVVGVLTMPGLTCTPLMGWDPLPVCGRSVGHAGPHKYTTYGLGFITCVWLVCWPCRASHVHHWWAGMAPCGRGRSSGLGTTAGWSRATPAITTCRVWPRQQISYCHILQWSK